MRFVRIRQADGITLDEPRHPNVVFDDEDMVRMSAYEALWSLSCGNPHDVRTGRMGDCREHPNAAKHGHSGRFPGPYRGR